GFSLYEITRTLASGTAQGGALDAVTLDAGSSSEVGAYNLARVSIMSGTGAGQTRTIVRYAGGAKNATVEAPWAAVPDATSGYSVVMRLARGTVASATATTVVLAPDASNESDAYADATLVLLDDPDKNQKTAEVRRLLQMKQRTVAAVAETVERMR